MGFWRLSIAALLLNLAAQVLSHGGDEHHDAGMGDMNMPEAHSEPLGSQEINNFDAPSYYGLDSYGNLMLAHIILMVAAWVFTLPIGVMLSVARSRLALPTQLTFLVLNGLGVIFGTVYNVKTPDLYEKNVHHGLGWTVTWIMVAQVTMSLLFTYSGRPTSKQSHRRSTERASFLPVSTENMAHHIMQPYTDSRWSGDSGHGTERSSNFNSRDISPTDPNRRDAFDEFEKPEPQPEGDDDDDDSEVHEEAELNHTSPRSRWVGIKLVDRYLSKRLPNLLSSKMLQGLEVVYTIIDKAILVLGYVALVSGGVTYAGIFRGSNVFNGLAHFVKGGIFFWYGLLTLGRFMGAFSDMGWSWNLRPVRSEVGQWKAAMPSAEFVESFVIWLYGCINVFLEHLAASGGPWNPEDIEHVAISVMFFGGGLCGMLIESQTVRKWLNVSVANMPTRKEVHPSDAHEVRSFPKSYGVSLNALPALVILFLGILMSSHHQHSALSTAVHKQWGNLLVGFSFARMATYLLIYISPPTSIFPSRPPTEVVAAFCLISGGLVFMASNKDVIYYLEAADLMPIFVLAVAIGLTLAVMSYEIIALAVKGWARGSQGRVAVGPVRY